MSDRDLVQELKSNIVDLTEDRDDALAKVKTKEARLKQVMIKLEHATQDVSSVGHKIADKDKEITKLKEKLKDKNKIVKKEIDEEIEKYITTNGIVEDDSKEKTEDEDENENEE